MIMWDDWCERVSQMICADSVLVFGGEEGVGLGGSWCHLFFPVV